MRQWALTPTLALTLILTRTRTRTLTRTRTRTLKPGEAVGTGAVGYAVRGDARQSASNSLLVCTAGVLLRRLEEEPDLRSFDVVLVDEVQW